MYLITIFPDILGALKVEPPSQGPVFYLLLFKWNINFSKTKCNKKSMVWLFYAVT